LRQVYPALFSRGFEIDQQFPGLTMERSNYVHKSGIVGKCLNDNTKRQLAIADKSRFDVMAKEIGLTIEEASSVWGFFDSTVMNGDDLKAFIAKEFPEIELLIDLWDNTALKNLLLTTVGTAIGYANLVRVTGFDADLSIWIK
jgi:hypothetical protein